MVSKPWRRILHPRVTHENEIFAVLSPNRQLFPWVNGNGNGPSVDWKDWVSADKRFWSANDGCRVAEISLDSFVVDRPVHGLMWVAPQKGIYFVSSVIKIISDEVVHTLLPVSKGRREYSFLEELLEKREYQIKLRMVKFHRSYWLFWMIGRNMESRSTWVCSF